jgi:hypothetical protein
MLQEIFITQAEKSWLDIILYGLFPGVASVVMAVIGVWQHKLKKQEWTRNNWGVYLKNYKLTEKAMGIVMNLSIPVDKNQWIEPCGNLDLGYGYKVERDIEEASKLIWQARDEAKLLLEEEIFKYVERLKADITSLKNLYNEYRGKIFPNKILSDVTPRPEEVKALRKKISQIIVGFGLEDYTLVYRKVTALKKSF